MSGEMAYVRKRYGVPAKRGGRIRFNYHTGARQDGTITSARDGYIFVSFDGKRPEKLHPTWCIEYHDAESDDSEEEA